MSDMESRDEELADRVVDRKISPRTLVLSEDSGLFEQVSKLVPNSNHVANINERRQEEYDLVIATIAITDHHAGGWEEPAGHLSIISFGVQDLGSVLVAPGSGQGRSNSEVYFVPGSKATEYRIPTDMPALLAPLVEADLLPAVRARTELHPILSTNSRPLPIEQTRAVPLLKTGDGGYLAAVWNRPGGGIHLALPGDVTDRVAWIKAALKLLRNVEPARFQQIPGWEELPEWSTAKERQLRGDLEEVKRERETVLAELEEREAQLGTELASASAEAEAGLRRLLTAQGDDLVKAVIEALTVLGFEVEEVDPQADQANRLEDLRVTDPEVGGWEAIVEVRGYRGGAQLSDLARVARFVRRYRDQTDRWPPSVWYIVNQRAGLDPELRQPVLSSQQTELEEWAQANAGLACDTSDLFHLIVDVEASHVGPADARRMLRKTTVRFTYSSNPEVDPS